MVILNSTFNFWLSRNKTLCIMLFLLLISFFLDCLSSFTKLEELADSELYLCHSCKCKQRSTKRFWIRRLPNVSFMMHNDFFNDLYF